MGIGDADRGGRLGGPAVAKVIADLDGAMKDWGDQGHLVATLREARDAIRNLSRPAPTAREAEKMREDPALQATGTGTSFSIENNAARITLFRGSPNNVLAWMVLDGPQLYGFASTCLDIYDKLEGISD